MAESQRATHMHVAALAIFEVGPLRSASGGLDAARLVRYAAAQLGKLPRQLLCLLAKRNLMADVGTLADDVDAAFDELRRAAGGPGKVVPDARSA